MGCLSLLAAQPGDKARPTAYTHGLVSEEFGPSRASCPPRSLHSATQGVLVKCRSDGVCPSLTQSP